MPSELARTPSVSALLGVVYGAMALLAPPPPLTVSQWADKYAVLPPGTSAEPGRWRTERAPYQREMMDVVNDPTVDTVCFMIGSQLGKTASEINTIFYFAQNDPSPILLVMPTEKDAEDFSKENIAPGIRDTPVLKSLFTDPKTRNAGNTTLNKSFPGGYLALAGANAPRGLARRSVRILIMDEIDGYPASSGTEGDPITLGEARTTNYWNRKRIFSSTPTDEGASRIEKLEGRSDQRRYFVPCPHCGTLQVLDFDRLKWPRPSKDRSRHEPENCYYVCVAGCEIQEAEKPAMIRAGKWVKTNPDAVPGTAGFQLSSLYSPWLRWSKLIDQYIKCFRDTELKKEDPTLLKAFTNTRLAKTFRVQGESVDDAALLTRKVLYASRVPAGALVLTCGVDVQGNRIEAEVVGWGEDDRSWSIDYFILRGDPNQPELWDELDEVLKLRYRHASGAQMKIASTFIDSGNNTRRVYKFVRPRQVRRVYACKGVTGAGVSLIRPRAQNRTHRGNVDLRLIGVDTGKEALYANLKQEDGAGYCTFPSGYKDELGQVHELPLYDKEYFEQLTGEQLVTRMEDMTPIKVWEKKRERNEALDCRVYAMAALEDLNIAWKKLAKNMRRTRTQSEPSTILEAHAEAPPQVVKTIKRGKKIIKRPGHSWINAGMS